MKSAEIRQKFLKFMEDRDHAIIPSAPVVPQNDPTVLFTTAGMHPLVPYLLGEPHPAGKRLADVQKCIRTVDIDEVGDESHLTFFEMLGNWSLGDYFKQEAIEWSWEFLTKDLELDPAKMAVSVFKGDKDAPLDEESIGLWKAQGVPEDRIFTYGKEDNWWGPAGQTGPCGPDTEIFYWVGDNEPESEPAKDERWLELWNNVFMEYEKTADGKFEPLAQKNVDTGMGLERLAVILQQKKNVYETDLFEPIISEIDSSVLVSMGEPIRVGQYSSERDTQAKRIIADHMKATTFILAEGVKIGREEESYIPRKLVRRAMVRGRYLGMTWQQCMDIHKSVISLYSPYYPELKTNEKIIQEELNAEAEQFNKTLDKGLSLLQNLEYGEINGKSIFHLFDTHGFPFEISLEEVKSKWPKLSEETLRDQFDDAFKEHRKKSRAGAEQKFAGGLADHSEKVVRQHTATHLLLAALRDVLGDDVKQRGSNITAERLRFDFSYPEKLTDEQQNQVEALVNEWIKEDLPVVRQEMPKEEAERLGAQMEFGHKYPDVVSVYFIGDPESARSMEFCGGPHVEHTGQIGTFVLKKQESVGAGVRRIKAVIEP